MKHGEGQDCVKPGQSQAVVVGTGPGGEEEDMEDLEEPILEESVAVEEERSEN